MLLAAAFTPPAARVLQLRTPPTSISSKVLVLALILKLILLPGHCGAGLAQSLLLEVAGSGARHPTVGFWCAAAVAPLGKTVERRQRACVPVCATLCVDCGNSISTMHRKTKAEKLFQLHQMRWSESGLVPMRQLIAIIQSPQAHSTHYFQPITTHFAHKTHTPDHQSSPSSIQPSSGSNCQRSRGHPHPLHHP